jgi:hypothetical protein
VSDVRNDEGVVVGTQFTWRNGQTRLRSRFAVVDQERELTWTGSAMGVKVVDRHVLSVAGAHRTRLVTEESMAGRLAVLFLSSPNLGKPHSIGG